MEKTFGNMAMTSCGVLGPGGIEKKERGEEARTIYTKSKKEGTCILKYM